MTNHHGENWPYHEGGNGEMVACASNPCRIHGGSDIMADSPEEAGSMMERVLSAADYWSLPSSSVIPYHIDLPDESIAVMNSIEHGDVLVVGGGVRDSIMGKSNKDIDLEVHGEDLDDIMHELRNHGIHVDSVGRTFGVLTARNHDWSIGVDIATPRRERKTGTGHTGFDTEQDPYMGVSEAAARRDFTCNAIMYDPRRQVILDPYHGVDDVRHHIMRATSSRFAEDPLRVLRGVQFSARFGLNMDDDTASMCRKLRREYGTLSMERVRLEWRKFYTRGEYPMQGFATLRKTGWDDTVPGLHEAIHNPMFMQRVNRAWKYDDRAIRAATVAYMAPPDARRDMLHHMSVGDDDVKRSMAFIDSMHADLSTRAKRREWEYQHHTRGISLHEVSMFAGIMDNDVLSHDASMDNGYIEPWIDGNDVRNAVPDRQPGRWISEVINEARKRQYEDRFSGRDEALDDISHLASLVS